MSTIEWPSCWPTTMESMLLDYKLLFVSLFPPIFTGFLFALLIRMISPPSTLTHACMHFITQFSSTFYYQFASFYLLPPPHSLINILQLIENIFSCSAPSICIHTLKFNVLTPSLHSSSEKSAVSHGITWEHGLHAKEVAISGAKAFALSGNFFIPP